VLDASVVRVHTSVVVAGKPRRRVVCERAAQGVDGREEGAELGPVREGPVQVSRRWDHVSTWRTQTATLMTSESLLISKIGLSELLSTPVVGTFMLFIKPESRFALRFKVQSLLDSGWLTFQERKLSVEKNPLSAYTNAN